MGIEPISGRMAVSDNGSAEEDNDEQIRPAKAEEGNRGDEQEDSRRTYSKMRSIYADNIDRLQQSNTQPVRSMV